jgi:hypothetical protein
MQNHIMIIAQILLKCKSYVFHIKTSQVKNTYHLYKSNKYLFVLFLDFESHKICMDIIL